jgi:Putative TM nitroreductase
MPYSKPIPDLIESRFSCRTYAERPIEEEKQRLLIDFMSPPQRGPFGTTARFELVAATEQDRAALKGLGTYGFIRGNTGFIIGAVNPAQSNLEDFGYLMECIVLRATDLDLGTCWLGGSFTRSGFAKRIALSREEEVPSVVSVGHIGERSARDTMIRQAAGSAHRFPWAQIFYAGQFGIPVSREAAGAYAVPLDMVRLAPSASNKQPWRVVKETRQDIFHFFLQRTKGYNSTLFARLLKMSDLQRIDMGIAMSHFELTAKELSLTGGWKIADPGLELPDELTEYTMSWVGEPAMPGAG